MDADIIQLSRKIIIFAIKIILKKNVKIENYIKYQDHKMK